MATSAAINWRTPRLGSLRRRGADRLQTNRTIESLRADGLQLGEGALVAQSARLAPPCHADPGRPWLITIGADSYIDVLVTILTHDGSLFSRGGLTRVGRVDIGRRVYVGPGAMILPGSEIGDDSVVEAGAVVRGTFPPGSVIAGNPAAAVADIDSVTEPSSGAAQAPCWPADGWSRDSGLTEERKRIQREALTSAAEGFLLPAQGRNGDHSEGPG